MQSRETAIQIYNEIAKISSKYSKELLLLNLSLLWESPIVKDFLTIKIGQHLEHSYYATNYIVEFRVYETGNVAVIYDSRSSYALSNIGVINSLSYFGIPVNREILIELIDKYRLTKIPNSQ